MTLLSKKKKDTLQEQTVEPATTRYEDSKGENFYTDHWDNPPTEEDYATQESWIKRKYANDPKRVLEEINYLNNYKNTSWTGTTSNNASNQTQQQLQEEVKNTGVNVNGMDQVSHDQSNSYSESAGSSVRTSTSEQSGSSRSESQMQLTPEAQKRILDEENKKKPIIPSQPATDLSKADQRTDSRTTSVHQSSGSSVSVGNQSGTSTSEQSGSSRSESQMQLTPEAQQAEREARDAYMQSHGYVKAPDGTWKLNQTLFDALNIPREDLRKERERQQKENRMKQLVSGLYHGGALLSDMISAGVGGNVWKREKDDTAEKAAAENKQLRTLQLAEDAAFAEKQRKDMQDTLDKAQQQADQRRRELMKTVSTQTHQSKGEQKSESSSTQQSVQNSTSVGTQTSVQGTTYSDALKGGGLVGRSRRRYGYGSGSGSSKNPDYIPVRLVNTANGQEYMTFEVDKAEKEALAGAVAASIQEAAANGDANARRLLSLYFTPGSRGKRGSKPTPDQWNYDGLINDASLYQVPGVLNRYLDELENLGVTYTDPKTNQEKAYSREQLYEMITGDVATKRVNAKGQEEWYYPKLPQGVTLSPKGGTIKSPWLR